MTVNDLITAALRRIRVISGSDPPDGDTINDALARFNDWIDDLKNQDFLDLFINRLTFPLVPGKPFYTLGLGGTQDIQTNSVISATDIQNCGYIDLSVSPSAEYQLGPVLSENAWAAVVQKAMPTAYPSYWYFNASGKLYPWPVPMAATLLGVLYFGETLQEVTINQVLNLKPGYRRFLRDGLAIELAPEFHVNDPAVLGPIKMSSEEALANIKRKTRTLRDLTPPAEFSLFGGGNIYSGT